jgi:predicted nucleotidyltransferase
MNSKVELENKLRQIKPELSKKFYVDKIGFFGSFINNEQREDSDIDILVDFRKPLGWDFFDLQELLEKELKRKIDLHTFNSIKENLKDIILKQVIYV